MDTRSKANKSPSSPSYTPAPATGNVLSGLTGHLIPAKPSGYLAGWCKRELVALRRKPFNEKSTGKKQQCEYDD